MGQSPAGAVDHALIGDTRTAALVGRNGAIDWLCLPRFDSPACLAALLDDERAGTWRVAPAVGGPATRRRYRTDTLVVEHEWDTRDGTVRLVDCMPPHDGASRVVRLVEGVSGRVPMRMLLRPRFDNGRLVGRTRREGRRVVAVSGPDAVVLDSDVPLTDPQGVTLAHFSVAEGQRLAFVLTHAPAHRATWHDRIDGARAVEDTTGFWRAWLARCPDRGPWDAAVRRAALTVGALTDASTGGILTSVTGDDRRCRTGDAAATLRALSDHGFTEEARAWREWLLRALAAAPENPRTGAPVPLAGWSEAHLTLADTGPGSAWDLRRALLDHLEGAWDRPGTGQPRRRHVHSTVLLWAALDHSVRAAERHRLPGPVDRWRALRARIRAEVCAKGYSPERNTFTSHYGSPEVDAALLLLPAAGFLPWRDARMRGTVEAVRADLGRDGLVVCHPGDETTSFAAGFWLVGALAGVGAHAAAATLFERLLALRDDLGLFAEGYDTVRHRQTGDVPHLPGLVGLLNSAHRLTSPG